MVHDEFAARKSTLEAIAITDSTRSNIVIGTIGSMVLVGFVCVLVHRFKMQSKPDSADLSMTRPVLAMLLVGAVVILAAASFTLDDAETRNLLIGGVVSLSSAAVAFYFASRGATEARRDLIDATWGSEHVPDLTGMTAAQAQETISKTHLALLLPSPTPAPGAVVTAQHPLAGTTVKGNNSLTVTF